MRPRGRDQGRPRARQTRSIFTAQGRPAGGNRAPSTCSKIGDTLAVRAWLRPRTGQGGSRAPPTSLRARAGRAGNVIAIAATLIICRGRAHTRSGLICAGCAPRPAARPIPIRHVTETFCASDHNLARITELPASRSIRRSAIGLERRRRSRGSPRGCAARAQSRDGSEAAIASTYRPPRAGQPLRNDQYIDRLAYAIVGIE